MQLITAEERDRLLAGCQREAVHLELRDSYAMANEAERLAAFLATGRRDDDPNAPDRRYWLDLIRSVTQSGRRVRRARIVSEPVTEYIRYEWAGTQGNIDAGEEVRWLPRRLASAIALPGNDFWLVDDSTVVFSVFTGRGEIAERQLVTDASVLELCRSGFEAVWLRPYLTTSTRRIDQPVPARSPSARFTPAGDPARGPADGPGAGRGLRLALHQGQQAGERQAEPER